MLKISTSFLESNRYMYNGVKDCIYNVGKNVLNGAVKHQYPLSVSIWSYFFIEVGRIAAATTFGENYVYNLETCREALCNTYWNKTEENDDFFHSPVAEFRCSQQGYSSYSFVECLQDLCKYMVTIGENFYACKDSLPPTQSFSFNETAEETTEDLETSYLSLIDYWNKICPKKEFRHAGKPAVKLKKLAYITNCLEKLCTPDNLIRFESPKDITSLCTNKDILKLYELLHRMSRTIKKMQKANLELNTDSTNTISNIIVAISTVVAGAATIAAAIISYRTSKAAQVLQNAIPSLDQGVRTISRAAAETTSAILRGSSIVEEMLPTGTFQTLHELSSRISHSSSSSFHSAAEGLSPVPEMRVKFDPNTKVINIVGGVGKGGIHVIGGGLGIGAGSIITMAGTSIENGGGGKQETSQLDQTIEKITLGVEEILPSQEPQTFNIRESWWFSYLKDTVPNWKDAYCYYEGVEKSLYCKLPRPPFDGYISFFLKDLKEFFSKNTAILCTPLDEELWCNWGKFLDVILSTRNITFKRADCEWDHFGLQIDKIWNDTYFLKAVGMCYNETNLLRV